MRPTLGVTFFLAELKKCTIVCMYPSYCIQTAVPSPFWRHANAPLPPCLNKVKPDPKGTTYFSGCCWHRRDPANFCKIRLTVLSERVSILVKIACRIDQNWPHFMVRGSKLILLCCLPLPLILKGQARPLSKIRIKLLGESNKNAPRQKWEPPLRRYMLVAERGPFRSGLILLKEGVKWESYWSIARCDM